MGNKSWRNMNFDEWVTVALVIVFGIPIVGTVAMIVWGVFISGIMLVFGL